MVSADTLPDPTVGYGASVRRCSAPNWTMFRHGLWPRTARDTAVPVQFAIFTVASSFRGYIRRMERVGQVERVIPLVPCLPDTMVCRHWGATELKKKFVKL